MESILPIVNIEQNNYPERNLPGYRKFSFELDLPDLKEQYFTVRLPEEREPNNVLAQIELSYNFSPIRSPLDLHAHHHFLETYLQHLINELKTMHFSSEHERMRQLLELKARIDNQLAKV